MRELKTHVFRWGVCELATPHNFGADGKAAITTEVFEQDLAADEILRAVVLLHMPYFPAGSEPAFDDRDGATYIAHLGASVVCTVEYLGEQAPDAQSIAESLSIAARNEIMQFDVSGEGNDREAMRELESAGLMHSMGRGDNLTPLGERVLVWVRHITNT